MLIMKLLFLILLLYFAWTVCSGGLRTLLISPGFSYLHYSFIFQIISSQDGDSEPGRTEMTLCVICPQFSLLFEILGDQKYISWVPDKINPHCINKVIQSDTFSSSERMNSIFIVTKNEELHLLSRGRAPALGRETRRVCLVS